MTPHVPGAPARQTTELRRRALAIGLISFSVFVASPQRVQSDSVWMVPLALQVVQHGRLTLDDYRATCEQRPHGCSEFAGHLRSEFPVGPALVAAVPLALFEAGVHLARPLCEGSRQLARWEAHAHATTELDLGFFDVTENLVASLCCALAAVFFFLAASRRVPPGSAMLVSAVFAFATPVWSTSSRVLWQSAPALMFSALALWLLVRARGTFGVGLALAAAWVCRPTMSLLAVVLVLVVASTRPRELPRLLGGAALVAGAFLGLNQLTLGVWLPPYFQSSRLDLLGATVPEAALAHLVSPGRGVFVFSPVLLLAFIGVVRALKTRSALELGLALWLVGHWVVVATFPHWWGGHSFGPRLWAETMVGACWLLLPALEGPRTWRVLLSLAVVSALIHGRGATSKAAWRWNDSPINVDEAPSRVWDWGDLQFLRR